MGLGCAKAEDVQRHRSVSCTRTAEGSVWLEWKGVGGGLGAELEKQVGSKKGLGFFANNCVSLF